MRFEVASGTYPDTTARPRFDVVASGVVTQVVYVRKTVTIRGGYRTSNWEASDPQGNPTYLNALGRGRVFYVTGAVSPTIENLFLVGGDVTGLGGGNDGICHSEGVGGGVYAMTATITLTDDWIEGNSSPCNGGGVYIQSSGTQAEGNTIRANSAGVDGGGIFLSGPTGFLRNNTIVSNSAALSGGGGVVYLSRASLSANRVISNTSRYGGGLWLAGAVGTFLNNSVEGNEADYGGGLLVDSYASLQYNSIVGNKAHFAGGGMEIRFNRSFLNGKVVISNTTGDYGSGILLEEGGNATLVNTVIADNIDPCALHVRAALPSLLQTTVARNSGEGICITNRGADFTRMFTNTIIVSQTVGVNVADGNVAILNGVLWSGNALDYDGAGTITITNDITGTPAFATDGYRLTAMSAAIDAGTNSGVAADIDGHPRPWGPGYDIGADEFFVFSDGAYLPVTLR